MKFGQQLDSKKDLEWRDEYADYGRGRKLIKKLRAKHEKRSVGSPTLAKQAARENTVTAARENTLTEVLLPDNATATCDDAGSRVASSPSTCGTESTVTVISPVPSEQEMPECLSDEQVQAYEFAEFIVSEWRRVNGFYSRTCEEFEHALDQMCSQADHSSEQAELLRSTFITVFKRLLRLKNFVTLNEVALRKILKKHDKQPGLPAVKSYAMRVKESEGWLESLRLDALIARTEQSFAKYFEDGDIVQGRCSLMHEQKPHNEGHVFKLGFKIGIVVVLLLWVMGHLIDHSETFEQQSQSDTDHISSEIKVFFQTGLAIGAMVLWGGVLWWFRRFRINADLIFQFDQRSRLSFHEVLSEATTLAVLYSALFLLYVEYSGRDIRRTKKHTDVRTMYFPDQLFPLIVFLYLIVKFFLPWASHWPTRRWLMKNLGSVIIAPFGECEFRHTFLADVLTSMVKMLVYLTFSICYYVTGDFLKHPSSNTTAATAELQIEHVDLKNSCSDGTFVIFSTAMCSALPLYIRFMQCIKRYYVTRSRFPHLANALKYAISLVVVLFGVFHHFKGPAANGWDVQRITWIVFFIISTLYSFSWDILMDWGIGRIRSQNFLLRDELMYRPKALYYVAILIDFILRFFWTFSLLPLGANPFFTASSVIVKMYLPLIVALLEICRRMMWALFRVENEQLVNSYALLREVRLIPVGPEKTIKRVTSQVNLGVDVSESGLVVVEEEDSWLGVFVRNHVAVICEILTIVVLVVAAVLAAFLWKSTPA